MSDTVIKVENLSKRYIIGHQKQERYSTLRDSITDGAKSLLKPFKRGKTEASVSNFEEFWALKDVSFEIKQGDRVGIIGRNGAGKSTLLKVLSRIVEPTSGRIGIKGRVASLLEVGTGFHPELTGRENISLNGAILGMSKVEIARKFDEIVAFAEVEKFLDTPVKRYSSGMYVRLAFAVAAHLEPEILIVDEVLAVGDAAFQKKCLGKMREVGSEGRTIIFVSHNMGAITTLCDRLVFLQKGSVREVGEADKIANMYLSELFDNNEVADLEQLRYPGMGKDIFFCDIQIVADNNSNLLYGEDLNFMFTIKSKINMDNIIIGAAVVDNSGNCIGSLLTEDTFSIKAKEEISINLKMSNTNLAPGSYHGRFSIVQNNSLINFDALSGTPKFQILPISVEKLKSIPNWHTSWGSIYFKDNHLKVMQ